MTKEKCKYCDFKDTVGYDFDSFKCKQGQKAIQVYTVDFVDGDNKLDSGNAVSTHLYQDYAGHTYLAGLSDYNFVDQDDMEQIKYCPMCGRHLA